MPSTAVILVAHSTILCKLLTWRLLLLIFTWPALQYAASVAVEIFILLSCVGRFLCVTVIVVAIICSW